MQIQTHAPLWCGVLGKAGHSAWVTSVISSSMMHHGLQFSSLPSFPSNWTYLDVQESTWNRNLVWRNGVLGTFWTETGKNPEPHVLLCGLFLCFLWNELRHSNSFQLADERKWLHCPSIESQHLTGKTAQLLSLLKNLYRKDKLLQSLFSVNWGFYSWMAWLTWPKKKKKKIWKQRFLPLTSRFLYKVKSLGNFIQNKGQKALDFTGTVL